MSKTKQVFDRMAARLLMRKAKADKVEHDPTLPSCPLCMALAIRGYTFATVNDIQHDCACVLESPEAYFREIRKLYMQAQAEPHFIATLPKLYRAYTLDTTDRTTGNAQAFDAVKKGLTANLYLYGEAGNGKTRLACAAGRVLAAEGVAVRFWGMAELFAALRDSYAGKSTRPELAHWGALILDDIDKLKPTPYVYETLYAILESRTANGLITIFTAQTDPNEAALILTPESDARAADPLASRMASGQTFKITGADRRST